MAGARYGSRCGAGVGGRGVVAGRARAERDACGPTGDVKNPGTHRGWRSAERTVAHRRERSLPSAVRRRPRGTACTVRWMTPRATASSTTGVLGAGAAAAIDHRPGISPPVLPRCKTPGTPHGTATYCVSLEPYSSSRCASATLLEDLTHASPTASQLRLARESPGGAPRARAVVSPKLRGPAVHIVWEIYVSLWRLCAPAWSLTYSGSPCPRNTSNGRCGRPPVAGLARSSPSSPPSRSFVATTDRHVRRQPLSTLECPLASRIPGASPSRGGVLHSGQTSSMYVKSHTQDTAFRNYNYDA